MQKIELLSPAKNLECGIAAINHGADAVYIGGPKFGARKLASNTLAEIESLITYAHRFNAKVYVALNTILFDHELEDVERLIHQIYQINADALIVQDMGILEMNLPPIALHASTQTDNRTWQKVDFLEKVGFDQVVLARELSLTQIKEIREKTNVKLEHFVHGALCVSYSGQCYMSAAINQRSANRGECGQPCRLPYTLTNNLGQTMQANKHLLSLKDLNHSNNIEQLLEAGITSLKIEGRLKDADYVKNITAWYRHKLDKIFEEDSRYGKASSGKSSWYFTPNPDKSFSRGFTNYFLDGRTHDIWSPDSPKSLGEKIGKIARIEKDHFILSKESLPLANGDGLCLFNKKMELIGTRVNKVTDNMVFPSSMKDLYAGATIFRNHDKTFTSLLEKSVDNRQIDIKIAFNHLTDNQFQITLTDEDNIVTQTTKELSASEARNPQMAHEQLQNQLSKLGGTIYQAIDIKIDNEAIYFIPAKELNDFRRQAIAEHDDNRPNAYYRIEIEHIPNNTPFPNAKLNYHGNIVNQLAKQFYQRHGVTEMTPGFELLKEHHKNAQIQVMTTKHCILHSIHQCLKAHPEVAKQLPLYLHNDKDCYKLEFDCKNCEMLVYTENKSIARL
jgi:putative protease